MAIAYGRFAKDDGMVVDIRKYDVSPVSVFNCRFWSDFTEENERLYIGSLHKFYLKTIHNVSTKEDYRSFVQSIDILRTMIAGYPYTFGTVSSSDALCLSGLMNDNKKNNIGVPVYIEKFFNNFCNQIKQIRINMRYINMNLYHGATFDVHRFLHLKKLFWNNNNIELIKFAKLFRNSINSITIYYIRRHEYESSIELNSGFEMELIKLLSFINSSSSIKNRFKSLIIVKPKIDNLNAFIHKKKDFYIKKYGWMAEIRPYHDIQRNSKCNDTIYFFPIV